MRKRLLLAGAVAVATVATASGVTGCGSASGSSRAPAVTASQSAAATTACGTATAAPAGGYRHVIWIMMENHSLGDIIGNKSSAPFINSIAEHCGLATDYHNATHPSLPNYLAVTSGMSNADLPASSYSDCVVSSSCDTSAQSIFGQGETWKSYEESMPSNCAKSDSGQYAVRHNPAVYYTSLSGCASNDVPYSQLATDLAGNDLPAFSFITPNLIDDMHDGTVAQGNTWLAGNLPAILNSSEYRSGSTAVFITWDEGSGGDNNENCAAASATDTSCIVPAIVISPSTPAGTSASAFFNHYSLLGTTEELLGLPKLGQAASAPTMTSAFRL